MDTAIKLFAEKAVSVRDIIQAAHIGNVGTISYYFGGKKGLYLEILREHFIKAKKLADFINFDEKSSVEKLRKIFFAIGDT